MFMSRAENIGLRGVWRTVSMKHSRTSVLGMRARYLSSMAGRRATRSAKGQLYGIVAGYMLRSVALCLMAV
jgi:hypothetical protein